MVMMLNWSPPQETYATPLVETASYQAFRESAVGNLRDSSSGNHQRDRLILTASYQAFRESAVGNLRDSSSGNHQRDRLILSQKT